MNATKVKISEAALLAFSRHGVRRVSMGDVAQAAGVSRQTLYSHFKNKDELFEAAMTLTLDQILNDLTVLWAECETISEKIDAYFKCAVYGPFDLLLLHPELKELLNGVGDATAKVAEQAEVEKAERLSRQFEPFEEQLHRFDTTPAALGTFILRTSSDLKFSAKNRNELDGHLQTLKSSVLALIAPHT